MTRTVTTARLVGMGFVLATIGPIAGQSPTLTKPAGEGTQSDLAEYHRLLAGQLPPGPHVNGQPIDADDVQAVQVVFGELGEQIRVASAKLRPDLLKCKRRMGTLRSLMKATDQGIARLSATIQRLSQRRLPLQEEVTAVDAPTSAEASPSRTDLLDRIQAPIQRASDQRDRLARRRAELESELKQLRRQHIQSLLAASLSDDGASFDGADRFDNFENFLQRWDATDEPAAPTVDQQQPGGSIR